MEMKIKDPFFKLLWLGAFSLLFISYSNHFENSFHFDDEHCIGSNAAIRDWRNIPSFFKDASTTSSLPANQAYRPGVTTLNAIDHAIQNRMKNLALADSNSLAFKFEEFFCPEWAAKPISFKKQNINPFYFHLSIFLSYFLLGILLYYFFLEIFNKTIAHDWNKYAALAATAFFWLHAANAETINYIISRSDSFSTLMIVLCFVMYMRMPFCRKYFLWLIPFIFGFFVKEPVLMLVPLLFFYHFLIENNTSLPGLFGKGTSPVWFTAIIKLTPAFLIGCALYFLAGAMTPDTWEGGGPGWKKYLATQPFVIAHYFQNFILPIDLSADTDWKYVESFSDYRIYAGLAFILALLWTAWMFSKEKLTRPISFGILWFLIALLPTSSVFALAEPMNDHRVFFPYIGLVMSFTWFFALVIYKRKEMLDTFLGKKLILYTFIIAFIAAHAAGTFQRNGVWKSGDSLWADVVKKSPLNGRGHMNYGIALMSKADFAGAWKHFSEALKIIPGYSYLHVNIGIYKNAMGLYAEAEGHYRNAIMLDQKNPETYYYYAQFLLSQNRIQEGINVANSGMKWSPGHIGLAELLARLSAMSIAVLDNAIIKATNEPSPENFLSLSLQYGLLGKWELSITAAEEAIKLKPDYDAAYSNLCYDYTMLKQWDKAIAAGEMATKINPNNQLAQNNLAESKRMKELEKNGK